MDILGKKIIDMFEATRAVVTIDGHYWTKSGIELSRLQYRIYIAIKVIKDIPEQDRQFWADQLMRYLIKNGKV